MPDAPLTLAQMGVLWLIIAVVIVAALILGDAINRSRQ